MKWTALTPRPSNHRGGGVYSMRPLARSELLLASAVAFRLGLRTLTVI